MKISQAQYFEIEEFLAEKCRLVETEFIQEMTDHFIDAIEAKLTEQFSFEKALSSTIQDFGGLAAIQKMEWQYRKGSVKKQLRTMWILEKSQFSGLKLMRTVLVSAVITALCIYLGLYKKDAPNSYEYVTSLLSGAALVPAFTLPIFFLYRHVKWLDIFGTVKSQMVVRALISYLLFVISVLSSAGIAQSEFSPLSGALLQSIVWTIWAVSCITLLEYSFKFEENYWFTAK